MVMAELGVVKEEGAMGTEEEVAVAVEVDVAAAVLETVRVEVGVVRVEEVVAKTVGVDKVAELLAVEEGVVRVEEVVAEAVEGAKVAELLVVAEGMVREVGEVASRSNTQSSCIPSSLNTRMTGSPRTNRRLSSGTENGTHSRAVATAAVEVADSAAWGAMAAEGEARGEVEAMAAAAAAAATVVTVAAVEAGVATVAEEAAGEKEEEQEA
jgi:hypothetical protein